MKQENKKRTHGRAPGMLIKPEWLSHIAEQVGEGVAVADLKGRLIFVNQAWARMHGYTLGQLIGKNLTIGHTRQQIKRDVIPFNNKVMKLGKWTGEVGHVKKDGTVFATDMTVTLLRDERERPVGLIGFAHDISDRKRAEQAQQQLLRVMAMVSDSNQAIARARDEAQLLQDICDLVVATGGYRMSWIGAIAPGGTGNVIPVASCGAQRGYLKSVRIARNGAYGQGPTGKALRSGRPAICKDIRTDPQYRLWRKEALKSGFASSAAFPLKYRGTLVGVLNVYSSWTGAFDQQEVSLLRELSDDLAYGIVTLRDRHALAAAGSELARADRQLRRQLGQLTQKQSALAESDRKYRELAESLPQTVFEMDRRGRLVYANRVAYHQFGHRAGVKTRSLAVLDLIVPADRQRAAANIGRRLAGGPSEHQEYTALRRDGTTFPINIYSSPITTDGVVTGLRGVIVDVTERKLAEQALQQSKLQYQTLSQISPVGIFQTDAEGHTIYVNPRWCEIAGVPQSAAMADDWLGVVHPDDRERVVQGWRQAVRDRAPSLSEYRFQRPDGTVRWVMGQAVPEIGDDGAVAGYVGTITDITDRKVIEQSLTESETKFRSLAETSPSGIFAYREKFIYVNPACEALTGYAAHDLLEMTFWQMVHPDHREMVRQRGLARQRGETVPSHYEFKVIRKDGTFRWVDFAATTVRFEGQPAGMGIIFDITERKAAEEQLRQSEAFNRSIVDHSPIGIAIRDNKGRLLRYNAAWLRIWALSEQDIARHSREITDQSFGQIYDHLGKYLEPVHNVFRRGGSLVIPELQIPDPRPGAAQWVRQYFYTIHDPSGAIDRIVVLTDDITAHKRAEDALLTSEEKYRRIFDGIVEGIFQTTPTGEVVTANPALVKMLGYESLQELQGINIERDGYVDPDNRKRFLELLTLHGEVRDFQSRWRRKDGSIIIISENARLVRDDQGTVAYCEGTVEDITEHVSADLALLDEKNKMAQLFEVSLSVARAETIQQQLDLTVKGLRDLNLFRRMVVIVKDADGRNAFVAHTGLTPQDVETIRNAPPASEHSRSRIFDPRYRISNSYFIPHDDREVDRYFTAVLPSAADVAGEWHRDDNLMVPLIIKGKFIGYISADEPLDGRIPTMETVRLLELYANQAAIAVENLHLYNDLERSYYDTLKAFVAAMEAKDPYTKGHSENVRHHALRLAQHMGLPPERIKLIDYSSLLHDIGKLGINEQILSKPSVLSQDEYELVKQHPMIGSQMVATIDNLSSTAPIIHSHHEYYDGSGYPGGIKGDQIPLESRIISVADAFEAMTSDRPYRKAYGFREALQRLEQASGTQFDREVVNAFIEMARRESEDDAQG